MLLVAIIAPAIASAKASASRTKCQSNLRQIGNAISSYQTDWSGFYPNTDDRYLWMGRHWRWPLKRYVGLSADYDPAAPYDPNKSVNNNGGILACPSDKDARKTYDATSYGYSAAFYHTPDQVNSMNQDNLWKLASPGPQCVSQSSSEVSYPSKKAIVADWISNHSEDLVGWWDWRGARNYLFADGHVKFLQAKDILSAGDNFPDINLTKDGIHGKDIP